MKMIFMHKTPAVHKTTGDEQRNKTKQGLQFKWKDLAHLWFVAFLPVISQKVDLFQFPLLCGTKRPAGPTTFDGCFI